MEAAKETPHVSDNPLYAFFMERPVEVRRACLLLYRLLRSEDPDKQQLGEAIGEGLGDYVPEHIEGSDELADYLIQM